MRQFLFAASPRSRGRCGRRGRLVGGTPGSHPPVSASRASPATRHVSCTYRARPAHFGDRPRVPPPPLNSRARMSPGRGTTRRSRGRSDNHRARRETERTLSRRGFIGGGRQINQSISVSAERRLLALAAGRSASTFGDDVQELIAHDHVNRHQDGRLEVTRSGRAYLARRQAAKQGFELGPFIAQHLDPVQSAGDGSAGGAQPLVDAAESPLVWLARRKTRDGRPLIAPEQLQAGERLRAEFTRAQMTPRVTSNWTASIAQGRRAGGTPAR